MKWSLTNCSFWLQRKELNNTYNSILDQYTMTIINILKTIHLLGKRIIQRKDTLQQYQKQVQNKIRKTYRILTFQTEKQKAKFQSIKNFFKNNY